MSYLRRCSPPTPDHPPVPMMAAAPSPQGLLRPLLSSHARDIRKASQRKLRGPCAPAAAIAKSGAPSFALDDERTPGRSSAGPEVGVASPGAALSGRGDVGHARRAVYHLHAEARGSGGAARPSRCPSASGRTGSGLTTARCKSARPWRRATTARATRERSAARGAPLGAPLRVPASIRARRRSGRRPLGRRSGAAARALGRRRSGRRSRAPLSEPLERPLSELLGRARFVFVVFLARVAPPLRTSGQRGEAFHKGSCCCSAELRLAPPPKAMCERSQPTGPGAHLPAVRHKRPSIARARARENIYVRRGAALHRARGKGFGPA